MEIEAPFPFVGKPFQSFGCKAEHRVAGDPFNPQSGWATTRPDFSKHFGVYLANRDARAALTALECGACTDWTR
jgi:hypothetical protein